MLETQGDSPDRHQMLLTAPSRDRPRLFREVYEDVLRRILAERRRDPRALQLGANVKIARFVRTLAGRGRSVLEIGCGFGATALHVGPDQAEFLGVDASPTAVEVARGFAARWPAMRFAAMDATRLEVADGRFDFAYSIDLVEHLHPDDVPAHLREVRRVLKAGGVYLIKTPSELTGPHEGGEPGNSACLHLREYRYGTILPLLREAGFGRPTSPAFSLRLASRLPGPTRVPAALNRAVEALALVAAPPGKTRRRIARLLGVKQVIVIARKA
jgi:SAM-dependent methyltransferase